MSEAVILKIVDVAFGGKGVARHQGMVVFIPFVAPGDVVTARLTKRKKNFAEGEAISLIEASSHRVEPPCPVFGECGGCSYQHIDYAQQLILKATQVESTLRRIGRFEEVPMRPMISSPNPYGYRNRIRVHRAQGRVGFYGLDGRTIVDVKQCHLASKAVNQRLARLRGAHVPEGDYSLRAPGGGPFFEQTNPAVAQALVAHVEGSVKSGQQLLVDAYCGGGMFAHALAPKFESVVGIDENDRAIEAAQKVAAANERYLAGDVAALLGDVVSAHESNRTTVILDPPATGVAPRVLEILSNHPIAEIVYVSCNPATLARDLAELRGLYQLEAVTPVDMFPQTAEIEVAAHLVCK